MTCNRDDARPGHHQRTVSQSADRLSPRRRLLSLLAGSGAAAAALPAHWTKPVADAVLLPVHAQTSCAGIRITMSWSDAAPGVNGTLVVREPGGIVVGPSSTIVNGRDTVLDDVRVVGNVLVHLGDAPAGESGSEEITVVPGTPLEPGTYVVGMGFDDTDIRVEVLCGSRVLFSRQYDSGRGGFASELEEVARMTVAADGTVTVEAAPAFSLF